MATCGEYKYLDHNILRSEIIKCQVYAYRQKIDRCAYKLKKPKVLDQQINRSKPPSTFQTSSSKASLLAVSSSYLTISLQSLVKKQLTSVVLLVSMNKAKKDFFFSLFPFIWLSQNRTKLFWLQKTRGGGKQKIRGGK